jgi:hypothetical protein
MGAKDARIQPIYGCKHREYLTLVDSAGAVITPSSPDTELIIDGAAAADATNELTEISSGDCYLDFTYTEMSAQAILVRPKSTGALTRAFTLFPQRLPILRSGTAQAGAAGSITLDSGASAKDGAYVGCIVRASNNTPSGIRGEWRKIMGYTGSTKVATVAPDWDNTPTSSTTFEILVPSDLSMVSLLASAAEVVDEFETQSQADPTGFQVNVKEVSGTAQTAGDIGAGVAAVKTKTDNLPSDPADESLIEAAITSAHSATNSKIDAVDDYVDTEVAAILAAVDTEVAAIKAKTDNLPSDPADESLIIAATDAIKGDTAAIKTKTDNLPSDPADESLIIAATDAIKSDTAAILADTGTDGVVVKAAGFNADAVTKIWNEVLAGTKTAKQLLGILIPAFAAGKVTGGGTTTITWRNTEDTFNAIVATVDANGNRSAVTINFA